MAITDFLDKDIPANDLAAALRVLTEFKNCESQEEYLMIDFSAWAKLEQLEEYLKHRVEGAPLDDATIRYRARMAARAADNGDASQS